MHEKNEFLFNSEPFMLRYGSAVFLNN